MNTERMGKAIVDKAKSEPVVSWALVMGFILATISMLQEFGTTSMTASEIASLEVWLDKLGLLILPVIISLAPRQFVTSLYKPRDNKGRELVPKDEGVHKNLTVHVHNSG